jgi:hypothetical protein
MVALQVRRTLEVRRTYTHDPVDQNSILWYTFFGPEWRNRQTRATQNRVGLTHVGSIPTSGMTIEDYAASMGGTHA